MCGYKKDAREAAIPPDVSGHAAGGAPLTEPHLAIAPLAFLGAQYADGHVFGFALIPPGDGDLLASQDFQDAVRTIAPWNDEAHLSEPFRQTLDAVGRLRGADRARAPFGFAAAASLKRVLLEHVGEAVAPGASAASPPRPH